MVILIITPDYPDRYKDHYPFVKQLVDELARQGHDCSVISPYSVTNNKRFYKTVEKDGPVTVYRPNYLSFSNFSIGKFRLSVFFRKRAILRIARNLPRKPDVIYCHFWVSAIEVFPYAKGNLIPIFVASGESTISSFFKNRPYPQNIANYVSGVVCVSTKNKEESVSLGLTTPDKCIVKPNSVNSDLFRQLDKSACRVELGLPQDEFIVSFVGAFIERKGANRVSDAIRSLSGRPVSSLFIGSGDVLPDCDNILFVGKLRHEQIPKYLCASDIFVLPTLREGCCNAIVEAMSCGLPVVSSNLPFNWDVLDDSNALLVNPEDISAIAKAIELLRDNNDLRASMAKASLIKAQSLTIDKRARDIVAFIESRL